MNFSEALGILRPLGDSQDDLRAAYRTAARKYHPDINPNGLELMKLINLAYEFLKKHSGKWSRAKDQTAGPGLDTILADLFDKIKTFRDINTEICGAWMWISGNTRTYKTELKNLGFRWSKNKAAWYWHKPGYKKYGKRTFSMGEIRKTWGSYEMDQEPLKAVG